MWGVVALVGSIVAVVVTLRRMTRRWDTASKRHSPDD